MNSSVKKEEVDQSFNKTSPKVSSARRKRKDANNNSSNRSVDGEGGKHALIKRWSDSIPPNMLKNSSLKQLN